MREEEEKKLSVKQVFQNIPFFFSLELIHFETINIFQHQIYL